jgi:hypothetical protein
MVKKYPEILAAIAVRHKKLVDLTIALNVRYNFAWRILAGYEPAPPRFIARCQKAITAWDAELTQTGKHTKIIRTIKHHEQLN